MNKHKASVMRINPIFACLPMICLMLVTALPARVDAQELFSARLGQTSGSNTTFFCTRFVTGKSRIKIKWATRTSLASKQKATQKIKNILKQTIKRRNSKRKLLKRQRNLLSRLEDSLFPKKDPQVVRERIAKIESQLLKLDGQVAETKAIRQGIRSCGKRAVNGDGRSEFVIRTYNHQVRQEEYYVVRAIYLFPFDPLVKNRKVCARVNGEVKSVFPGQSFCINSSVGPDECFDDVIPSGFAFFGLSQGFVNPFSRGRYDQDVADAMEGMGQEVEVFEVAEEAGCS